MPQSDLALDHVHFATLPAMRRIPSWNLCYMADASGILIRELQLQQQGLCQAITDPDVIRPIRKNTAYGSMQLDYVEWACNQAVSQTDC